MRSPHSSTRPRRAYAYQWSENGQPIAAATTTTFAASQPGSYTCTVTATNAAGSTSQTSAALVISTLKLTKVKLNKRKGTAIIYSPRFRDPAP